MTYDSIYIDPDGVSNVSNQMMQAADELESLRHSIVPQVYEVINITYPDLGTLPELGIHVGSAQDSIVGFDYRAKTIVSDLRTSAYTLHQVAEEGRLMMSQLLHDATLFGTQGQSNTASSILNTILGNGPGSVLNAGGSLLTTIENIFQSEPAKNIADISGSLLTIGQEIARSDPNF